LGQGGSLSPLEPELKEFRGHPVVLDIVPGQQCQHLPEHSVQMQVLGPHPELLTYVVTNPLDDSDAHSYLRIPGLCKPIMLKRKKLKEAREANEFSQSHTEKIVAELGCH
jgi:hypothetical protein